MATTFNKNKSILQIEKEKELRLKLLSSEYDNVKRLLRAHPYIRIKEVFGSPPDKYHIVYRVEGMLQAGKSIESKNWHFVEIVLPDDYPVTPPVCAVLSPIFHPNISTERIDIKEQWTPKTALADLIVIIGQMIMFQRYTTGTPFNKDAAQWAMQNKNLLPLSAVDLSRPEGFDAMKTVPVKKRQPAELKDAGVTNAILIHDDADPAEAEKETQPDTKMLIKGKESAASANAPKTQAVSAATKPPLQQPQKKAPQTPFQEEFLFEPENKPGAMKTPLLAGDKDYDLFCECCGNNNYKRANFCTHCGVKFTKNPPRRTVKAVLIASMIAVPVMIVGAGIVMMLLTPKNPAPVLTKALPVAQAVSSKAGTVTTPAVKEQAVEKPTINKVEKIPAEAAPAIVSRAEKGAGNEKENQKSIPDNIRRARMYLEIGSYDEAINSFLAVLKSDSTNRVAKDGLEKAKLSKLNSSGESYNP